MDADERFIASLETRWTCDEVAAGWESENIIVNDPECTKAFEAYEGVAAAAEAKATCD